MIIFTHSVYWKYINYLVEWIRTHTEVWTLNWACLRKHALLWLYTEERKLYRRVTWLACSTQALPSCGCSWQHGGSLWPRDSGSAAEQRTDRPWCNYCIMNRENWVQAGRCISLTFVVELKWLKEKRECVRTCVMCVCDLDMCTYWHRTTYACTQTHKHWHTQKPRRSALMWPVGSLENMCVTHSRPIRGLWTPEMSIPALTPDPLAL